MSATMECERKKNNNIMADVIFRVICLCTTVELGLSLWISCHSPIGLIKSLFLTDRQHINERLPFSKSYILPALKLRWTRASKPPKASPK